MSTQLARAIGGFLERRVDRRSFLGRAGVAGAALATTPVSYVLRPTSAYAAVCSCAGQGCACGSLCCTGYTEFCCTMSGVNACPAGTVMAGWWKVDGSTYCGGGARYYMDCNASCGTCGCDSSGVCSGSCSGTRCGCAKGDCANRKTGCNRFRYGNCNNQVECVGPIVCRVVSCSRPWEIDAGCSTSARVDGSTATHDRSCLHRVVSRVDVVEGLRGVIHVGGYAYRSDRRDPITVEVVVDGMVAGRLSAALPRPDVAAVDRTAGPLHGFDGNVAAAPGRHRVVIRTSLGSGSVVADQVLSDTEVTVLDPKSPFGGLDALVALGGGRVRVRGWAHDPDATGPIDVELFPDASTTAMVTVRANLNRPDIAAFLGGGTFPFGFETVLTLPVGPHFVCAWAKNVGGGSDTFVGIQGVDVT